MAPSKTSNSTLETVEPIGARVLIRKDEDKKQTSKGIHLPDKIEIPTITGRVVAISTQVDNDPDQLRPDLVQPKECDPGGL